MRYEIQTNAKKLRFRLQLLREERVPIREVAAEIGIERSTLARIERGGPTTLEILERIGTYYATQGVDVSDFILAGITTS